MFLAVCEVFVCLHAEVLVAIISACQPFNALCVDSSLADAFKRVSQPLNHGIRQRFRRLQIVEFGMFFLITLVYIEEPLVLPA
jgi:hypothetical protein